MDFFVKIEIVSIAKKERSIYDPLYKELIKHSSKFATIDDVEIFNSTINKAHSISASEAQKSYSQALEPYMTKGYSVILHPDGKKIDSYGFSKLLDGKISLKFFVGGAYGFEQSFLDRGDAVISLGDLTMSHKIAKAVLLEQIYRAFAILSNHPYHK